MHMDLWLQRRPAAHLLELSQSRSAKLLVAPNDDSNSESGQTQSAAARPDVSSPLYQQTVPGKGGWAQVSQAGVQPHLKIARLKWWHVCVCVRRVV